MSLKAIEWMETKSILRIIDDRIFPKEIVFIDLSDEIEIAQAIKDKVICQPQLISVAVAYAMAVTAKRHACEDKYTFMDKLYEVACLLRQKRPTEVNIDATLKRIMGLAFISTTPKDMEYFSMQEAKMIESENDLDI